MTAKVKLLEGKYKHNGQPANIVGKTFELIKGYKVSGNGDGYITVDGSSVPGFPPRAIRIRVKGPASFTLVSGALPVDDKKEDVVEFDEAAEEKAIENETDEQIMERIRDRFEILTDMTLAIKSGDVRAMIVSGPAGVGKSFEVEAALNKNNIFNNIGGHKPKFEVVKGAMTALGLYAKLHEFSDKGNVIVFDDCDSILFDDTSLNILKAALDSSKSRRISWNSDSHMLRREGIPNSFDFNAGAIFITNIKFDHVRSKRLKDHLDALESRCHYLDLAMTTTREKVLRIHQIVGDGMLKEYQFTDKEQQKVVDFVIDNKMILRELTLRMVLKVADLYKSFPKTWEKVALTTCSKAGQKKIYNY